MTRAGAYRDVFLLPGAARVFLPALVGRLSFAMVTLALLFAVQSSTGSFALAGAATGAFGLANVLASPYRARLVDRRGQRVILRALVVAYAIGLCALAALTATPDAGGWAVVLLAAATGLFPPPLGAAMRVVWGRICPTPALRIRAYSVDAVCEELLFTTGPLLAAGIITIWSAPAALLLTAGVAIVGTVGMTSSTASLAQPTVTVAPPVHARPLRQRSFFAVLVALLGVGVVLGVVEVAAPAFADSLGSVGLAGVLLAAFATGSAFGGLLYGHRDWSGPLSRRLIALGLGMALFCALLALAPSVVFVGFGLAAVGFFLAPSLITGYLLADSLTGPEVRTEAASWINTAVNTGAALAAAGAGLAVDTSSTTAAFLLGAGGALACLTAAAPILVKRGFPAPSPARSGEPASLLRQTPEGDHHPIGHNGDHEPPDDDTDTGRGVVREGSLRPGREQSQNDPRCRDPEPGRIHDPRLPGLDL
ncbi:MFS family permease [Cryobacterium roopkundense]|uniref:MFS family permease n=1 Tax=Cryobacterium roopkundense TaxID=1001240 RepID=A0A7W9E5B9_9MICO|nr:MFS family permease [Cryobacterium roopkundense]